MSRPFSNTISSPLASFPCLSPYPDTNRGFPSSSSPLLLHPLSCQEQRVCHSRREQGHQVGYPVPRSAPLRSVLVWSAPLQSAPVRSVPLPSEPLRSVPISYPGYAAHLLARLRFLGLPSCNPPSIYIPPVFGSRAPQSPTGPDLSLSVTPSQAKQLQVAVGFLLYYDRCVDGRIPPHPLHHGQSSTSVGIRGRTSGYAAACPLRRLLPLPPQGRQRHRWPELPRAH